MREDLEKLWKLLDNIDTLSDICKPTVENPKAAMAFYNNAMRYSAERFNVLKSDGYKLYNKEEWEEYLKNLPKEEPSYKSINE